MNKRFSIQFLHSNNKVCTPLKLHFPTSDFHGCNFCANPQINNTPTVHLLLITH